MLPIILGGVALAATGYGVKKYLEDDDNREKVSDSLMKGCDNIDAAQVKVFNWLDAFSASLDDKKPSSTTVDDMADDEVDENGQPQHLYLADGALMGSILDKPEVTLDNKDRLEVVRMILAASSIAGAYMDRKDEEEVDNEYIAKPKADKLEQGLKKALETFKGDKEYFNYAIGLIAIGLAMTNVSSEMVPEGRQAAEGLMDK